MKALRGLFGSYTEVLKQGLYIFTGTKIKDSTLRMKFLKLRTLVKFLNSYVTELHSVEGERNASSFMLNLGYEAFISNIQV